MANEKVKSEGGHKRGNMAKVIDSELRPKRSKYKKQYVRESRRLRQDIVHAAGCRQPSCDLVLYYISNLDDDIISEVLNTPNTRIPRSLRPLYYNRAKSYNF